jgi:uncharacterized secreted protein with C-terminal beta-propeller domain
MEESVANIAAPTNSAADAAAGSSTSAATPPQAAIAGGASDSASSGTGASSSASSGTGASDSASSGTGASGSESSMSPSGSAASSSASPEIAPGSSMTQKSTADLGTTLDSNATADHSFSTTNTQVEGIDEADIIKTDGKNIYIVVDDEVVIVKADGTETSELSRMKFIDTPVELYITNDIMIVLTNGTSKAKSGSKAISTRTLFYDVANAAKPVKLAEYGQDGSYNSSRLNNDVLYLISRYFVDTNKMREDDPATYMPKIYDGDQYVDAIPLDAICIFPDYNSSAYTIITTYSLASNNVEKIGELAYLGASETLYMSEGNLYLTGQISGYEYSPMLGRETSAVDPEMLGTTDAAAALSESHASAAPGVSSVVEPEMSGGPDVSSATEPEMSGGSAKDSIEPVAPATTDAAAAPSESPVAEPAMSGGSGVSSASSASWAGDVSYVGNEYKVRQKTSIVRIALNNGNIAMAAETVVPGYLLNQFSLDEYQGYLRAAFNNVNSGVNEAGEFKYDLYNSLLVLDQDLGLVGSLSGLGKDESIYSVRFAGTVGYIVTFRQTDPLFSIDLSDPANPKVMDALKIPGFSEYLHPYADGLLLGIGKDTNGIGSLSGYLKISMFDTSDPYNIVEKSKELIDAFSAEALSNHKSVLIDAQKNIIGFSVQSYSVSAFADDVVKQSATANMSSSVLLNDSGGLYLIYGYSKNGGFYKRAAVVLPDAYTSTRALFIDDYLYIVCAQDIAVCKMNDLDKVKDLDGDDVFTWISVRSKELQ